MKKFEFEYLLNSIGLLKSFEFFSNFKLYFHLIEFILCRYWLILLTFLTEIYSILVIQPYYRILQSNNILRH